MTEDPQDRGYRPTKLWGQLQLQSVSISNGDERWPVDSPAVKGHGMAMQLHSNKQKARAPPMCATQQPINKAFLGEARVGPVTVSIPSAL